MQIVRRFLISISLLLSFTSVFAGITNDSADYHTKDTIKDAVVRSLRFDNSLAIPTIFEKDSINDNHFRSLPYYKATLYPAYLGVVGQAAYSLSYFDNRKLNDNPFMSPFALSFFSAADKDFYNTRRPFTIIKFVGSSNMFESFNALHTQNITKEWNIGFEMNFYGAIGAYNYQKASTHDMRLFTTFFGSRYSIVAQYSFNRLFSQENGGVKNVEKLRTNSNYDTKMLDVYLSGANSVTRFTQLYIKQEFNLTGRYRKPDSLKIELNEFPLSLGHELKSERSYRMYKETLSALSTVFYPTKPLNSATTRDSSISKVISNFFFLKASSNKKRSNIQTLIAGVGVETENYIITDYEMWGKSSIFNNGYLQMNLWNKSKSHKGFDAQARYYLSGRKQSNIETHAGIYSDYKKFDSLRIEANIDGQISSPSYFYTTYRSNHFSWNNNNLKNQQVVTASAQIHSLHDKYHLKVSASVLQNYVYVSDDLSIQQHNDNIIVYALDAGKKTNVGCLYLSNNIVFQHANTSIISAPQFVTVNTIALKARLFKKALKMKVGLDIYYWSKFYEPGYMPELGVFYKQSSNKTGDYPLTDVFIQFDYKRLQFFLKYSHASYYLTSGTNFNTVNRYPLDKPAISYGLSWYFYN